MTRVKKETITLPAGTKVPDHIAMILDGNRRWARARGLAPWEGHRAGYEAVRRLMDASRSLGVHTFTVWAFSTENWERPEAEVKEIINLLRLALAEAEPKLHKDRVRLVHLGSKERIPEDVVRTISRLEEETYGYGQNHVFNIAFNYGGREEIIRAVNKAVESGKEISAEEFEKLLDTGDQPYPNVDLFIRTSGEQRTSGLLPWQMEYAEYYFEPDHLPDFTPEKLKEAILDYSRRRRRFGGQDAEEHLKFDPGVVARLELDWQRALAGGENERLRDLVTAYVREHYGLSKELAKSAGLHLYAALRGRRNEDWVEAKKALMELYGIVQETLKLAFEPEIVANFEVNLWRDGNSEEKMRELLAEKFRFSKFQAAKSARLAHLANAEAARNNWDKARWYMERYYEALKERVA